MTTDKRITFKIREDGKIIEISTRGFDKETPQATISLDFDKELTALYQKIRLDNVKRLLFLLRALGYAQQREQVVKEIRAGAKNGISKRGAYDYAYALEFIRTYIDWNVSVLAGTNLRNTLIDWIHCYQGFTWLTNKKRRCHNTTQWQKGKLR